MKHLLFTFWAVVLSLLYSSPVHAEVYYEYEGNKTIRATVGDVITLAPEEGNSEYGYYTLRCYRGGFETMPSGLELVQEYEMNVGANWKEELVTYVYKCDIKCLKAGTYTVVHKVYADSKYRNYTDKKPIGTYWSKVTFTIIVSAPPIEPTSISLPSSKTVEVGRSFTMTYTITPSNASTTLTWTSDDTSIATVSSSGVVKGIKAGSTYIRVKTSNGKTDYCKVTVETVEPISISLPSSKTVKVGNSFTMTPTIIPSNAVTTLTWTSDDTSIATVSSSGVVKGIKPGSTAVQVTTSNGKTDYCEVTVEGRMFTEKTTEGVEMKFTVISETEKTCLVGTGRGLSDGRCVDESTEGHLTVPKTAQGMKVVEIGSGAFFDCCNLTSITIPNSVTAIGEYNQEIKGETNVEIIPVIA